MGSVTLKIKERENKCVKIKIHFNLNEKITAITINLIWGP